MSVLYQYNNNSNNNNNNGVPSSSSYTNAVSCLTPTIMNEKAPENNSNGVDSGSVGGHELVIGESIINSTNNNTNNNINNNNNNNNNANVNINSGVVGGTTRKADSDQSTIPSPPLSPAQRTPVLVNTRTTTPITLLGKDLFDSNNKELFGKLETQKEFFKDEKKIDEVKQQKIEQAPPLSKKRNHSEMIINTINDEFPLEKMGDCVLKINAWSDLTTNNFKKRHISFLQSYSIFRGNSSSSKSSTSNNNNFNSKRSYNTIPRTRRNIHHINTTSDDNSETERVRTRRVAREASRTMSDIDEENHLSSSTVSRSSPLPSSVTHHNRPSTPKKPRKPKTETYSTPSSPVIVDYESIPDYSPDISTLPNNSKCLKTEWKGQPMNLSYDPLISKLHPAEVTLASILRLPCSIYLDSKRRLFAEKVSRLRKHLPFRRTDAQKACKIDVNKASRLFASFEKVGWLKDENFKKFLKN
ncbi:hypothetical protein PACTADRAFT_50056 [Pachysolen tannophilus NRRL Y-2460]|uniref:SWIRM domain-containing protein n=1 Tax=Pachysolen tannophilus NRRL Y-2460 TaxID=669874 RepID=A0A1E4TUC3_PACTA|nr:hypothetical protein PACTADRAFT_50056 [Pachysolen tannophilus NRRL Y-2460]